MNTHFVLTPEIKVISLRARDTFKHLVLKNACIVQGQALPESTPYIAFTLLGDGIKFTAHANRMPGTDAFNCFDLLEAAIQAVGATDGLFERVEIQAYDEHYDGMYRIEGELLIE